MTALRPRRYMEAVSLSDHFTYKKLFKAVFAPILMMIFTSIYSIVDGLFISNFVGKTAFAAINLIMPVIMIFGAIGFMMGTGGSALVSKTLGEGDEKKANEIFSMIVYVTIIIGILVSIVGVVLIEQISRALGATDEMMPYCVLYGRILISANFLYMLQNAFQALFITAEKPNLGFIVIVVAGVTNIVLDALFVVGTGWGLVGAAVATVTGYAIAGIFPIIYFASKRNKSLLRLVKTKFDLRAILKASANGSSELVSNISSSIVSMLFNAQLLKFAGENGVAAYGVIMYAGFIFVAIFCGYSVGVAPIIGYHFGAENKDELRNLLKKSMILISITGVVMLVLTEGLARPLSSIFVSYDKELLDITTRGMRLYGISFLLVGFNIFASSFFTALNDGFISALISFIRTLVLQIVTIIVMPIWLGIDGVWLSVVVAEILAMLVSVICLLTKQKKYGY